MLSKHSRKRIRKLSTRCIQRWDALRDYIIARPASFVANALGKQNLLYPNFIIIGAPKCGTSWLQSVLKQHPEIAIVPDEIEYFSNHIQTYPLHWYTAHFTRCLRAAPGSARILGEKSARYCTLSPARIELVHRLLPDARLILLTRDPIARHWAQAKRYFSKRRFNKDGDVLQVPPSVLLSFLNQTRPLSEFSTMIANWTAFYPSDRLLILSQEKMLARPQATLNAVLQHIGASPTYDPTSIKFLSALKNRGPRIEMPPYIENYLREMFAAEQRRLLSLFAEQSVVRGCDDSVKRLIASPIV
jgi:hypothetical protein